jgi:hypothetical protein
MIRNTSGDQVPSRLVNVSVIIGFLALAAAILVAHRAPATAYELSIYAATPVAFWAGAAVALLAALVAAFGAVTRWGRAGGTLLGGTTVVTIIALPLIRGYQFYGTADPMSHLGWSREMATGAMSPVSLFYPGLHTFTVLLSRLTGVPLERSLLVVVLTFAALFFVFVPLVVRAIDPRVPAVAVGAFTALLLLPINNVSMFLRAHPFSQTTFFTALVLLLLFVYLTRSEPDDGLLPGALGLLLGLGAVSVTLYHPQVAGNVLLFFAVVCGVQFVARRRDPSHRISTQPRLYGVTGFFAVFYAAWVLRSEWFYSGVTSLVVSLSGYLTGAAPVPGTSVETQGESLVAIGGSIPELFVKLFLVSTVFAVLAFVLMVASVRGRLDEHRSDADAIVRYLTYGILVVAPLVVVYFLASVSEMHFRHHGFIMLLVSVLGALALTRVLDRFDGRTRKLVPIVFFALLLPFGLATAYQSPYIYKANQHVTEAHLDGYDTAFDVKDEEIRIASVREGPRRENHALNGVPEGSQYTATVNESEVRDTSQLPGVTYVVYSEFDRQREVNAYRELRYSQGAFDSLSATPGVDRVQSNGDVRLYLAG